MNMERSIDTTDVPSLEAPFATKSTGIPITPVEFGDPMAAAIIQVS
jgi:hypothetical protein